jgi:hypothetical protein
VLAGTYSQVRLIPVDSSAPLTTSAQNAGASFNAEADYVDSDGNEHQLPLELLNPDQGIGIGTSLKVPVGKVDTKSLSTSPSSTTGAIGTTGTTGTTASTTSTSSKSSTNQTPNEFAVAVNGTTDLVPFTFGGATAATASNGIVLSAHPAAYDLSTAGAISGQLTLTNISSTTSTTGLPAIQVNAETLSADGTRHVVVASTMVQSDGNFLLYPLATTSSNIPLTYDLVIHGPGIATIIIKAVQVPRPKTSTTGSNTSTTGSNTSTTGSNTSTTGSNASSSTSMNSNSSTTSSSSTSSTNVEAGANSVTVTPVSIGTLTPRTATTYKANISTSAASPLPAGAQVSFYQTINVSGEVPYVIESSPVDPFNQNLFNPQTLSAGTIDSGTWSTDGGEISVVSAAPKETTGRYLVAATAPSYADGPLGTSVAPPSSGTVTVPLPGLALASGAVPGTLSATITQATPGKYNRGQLLVSHEGALVASAPLDAALAQGGSVTISALPAGTPDSLYYVSVRVWNSRDPSRTLQRQSFPNAIDMRSSLAGSLNLTVN